jgi:starvation-inducible DNA-binding protein
MHHTLSIGLINSAGLFCIQKVGEKGIKGHDMKGEEAMNAADVTIGISQKDRVEVSRILAEFLADEYVLYTKTRNFHWNVIGMQFSELHKFFESQYEALSDVIDEIAERIRALGEPALGSLAEFVKFARLQESPGRTEKGDEMLSQLLHDHQALIRQYRAEIGKVTDKHGDVGTGDFLTGLMEQHEKMAWMVRSHLERSSSIS